MKYTAFFILIIGCFFSTNCFGQFTSKLSAEIGGGGTVLYGDLKSKPISFGSHIGVRYHFSPFVSAGLQGQMGVLKGHDVSGRDADNHYTGANAQAVLHAGQFMPSVKRNYSFYKLTNKTIWSYLANVYVGAGIGFLYSDIDAYREPNTASEVFAGSDYVYEMVVPINVGIDIPFNYQLNGPIWALNFNYQLGLSFGDNLDGYSNSYSSHHDRMVYFSVGIKRVLTN